MQIGFYFQFSILILKVTLIKTMEASEFFRAQLNCLDGGGWRVGGEIPPVSSNSSHNTKVFLHRNKTFGKCASFLN